MRQQIYYTLSNNAGVTALVSTRIYSENAVMTDSKPYITFSFDGMERNYEQSGVNTFRTVYLNIEIVGTTLTSCQSVANAVFTALNLNNAQIGDVGSKIEICGIYLQSESDDYFITQSNEFADKTINQTYKINYMEA